MPPMPRLYKASYRSNHPLYFRICIGTSTCTNTLAKAFKRSKKLKRGTHLSDSIHKMELTHISFSPPLTTRNHQSQFFFLRLMSQSRMAVLLCLQSKSKDYNKYQIHMHNKPVNYLTNPTTANQGIRASRNQGFQSWRI